MATKLSELADSLFSLIKQNKDPFLTFTVVCPNIMMQQWIKHYWLKTQDDKVLMNVVFKSLNDIIPDLVDQKNYKLIKPNVLRQVVLSIITTDSSVIPAELQEYYKDDPIKLYDFASTLSSLLLEYYRNDFEDLDGFDKSYQHTLYEKVVEVCKSHNFGTIEKPSPTSYNRNKIYLFGFSRLDKVYRRLVDNCSFVEELKLDVDPNADVYYTVSTAPSMVREIESIHSEICKLLHNGASVSDFLVVGPNIHKYETTIERVFRQNDTEYPSIPYVISYHDKADTDVVTALKLLFKIFKNGFYTRLDFYNLVTNPIIQQVRGIDNDEVEGWMTSIVNLNIHRNHSFLNDWHYIKTRLLLSKVSSVNFLDNVVALKSGDYLPYTTIQFEDSSIKRIVSIIDDLDSFVNLLTNKTTLDKALIDSLKQELDKWFSFTDGEVETNPQYKKLLQSLQSLTELDISNILVDDLFYILFDDGKVSSIQRGNGFIEGITFLDFDVNAIYSTKYVFLIGFSADEIPLPVVKNEMDLRKNIESFDTLGFSLLYQNVLQKLYISFVSVDLKNEEEFFLSPLALELNKKKNKYLKKDQYIKISLDEKRKYSELFTRKEFKDKEFYIELLNSGSASNKITARKAVNVPPKQIESLFVSDLSGYLSEPLSYKINELFNKEDKLYKDIKDEWEPFTLDNLKQGIIINKVLYEMVNKTFDNDETLETLKNSNLLPTINDLYQKHIYDELVATAENAYSIIVNYSNKGQYEIIPPTSIKLNDNGFEWMLTSTRFMCRYINGSERSYFELKKMSKDAQITQFLDLYIMALMDIVDTRQEGDDKFHIILIKGEKSSKQPSPYGARRQFEFDITYGEALKMLNGIHSVIGDYAHNVAAPLDLAGEKDLVEYYKFENKMNDREHGPWRFFDHQRLVDKKTDLGYEPEKYKHQQLVDEINKQIEFIKYLEKIILNQGGSTNGQP